ncbi:MAG: ferredoxin [Candidatus Woesearchaeota archaeon]|nr:ferredoxin [Candidatus Woesearchaeota archaeon]
MAKYKISFDRELCIGVLACAGVAEKFYKTHPDGKVDLIGGTFNAKTKRWELIIDEKDLDVNKMAAEVCPVIAIIIEKLE